MASSVFAPTGAPRIKDDTARGDFIAKTYGHVAAAFGLFLALELLLFMSGIAKAMGDAIAGNRFLWFLVLGGVMLVSSLATSAAHNVADIGKQYKGLGAMAAIKAVMFAPLLYWALVPENGESTIATAGVVTLLGVGGLSAVAYTTRKDLSFLRPIVSFGMVLALIAIVGGLIFGFNLGLWFSVIMVGLAGARILHLTQDIIRRYPEDAYVGAAVQLFASYMLMFWYVLRIFMQRN
jgi:FtsH-binding integral membrane protein